MIKNNYELFLELKKGESFFEEVIKMISKTDREAMNNPTIEYYLFFDFDINEFEIVNKYNCWGAEPEFAESFIDYYYKNFGNMYLFNIFCYDDYPEDKYLYDGKMKYKYYEEMFDKRYYEYYRKELVKGINSYICEKDLKKLKKIYNIVLKMKENNFHFLSDEDLLILKKLAFFYDLHELNVSKLVIDPIGLEIQWKMNGIFDEINNSLHYDVPWDNKIKLISYYKSHMSFGCDEKIIIEDINVIKNIFEMILKKVK